MKLEIPITVEFDDVWGIVDEIKSLQTYKLSEDDDMLLVNREDVADILARHVKAKNKQLDGLPSAQPEQLGTNLAEVGTEPTNIVKNCNDKSSGSDDYSYKSAEVGTDMISRQAAIDVIFGEPLYKPGLKKRAADEVVPVIYEKIKSLPSAQQKPLKYSGDSICIYCVTGDCDGCMYEPMEGVING